MRLVSLLAATALIAAATAPADAAAKKKVYRERSHMSITVNKPRSYLDAGTEVKPGSKGYHDYYYLLTSRYPDYGPPYDNRYSRWPLPGPYDWTPY